MKKLLLLLLFPLSLSAQILEKDFLATVTYSSFTQINDSLFRGDLVKFVDALDGNVTDSVQAGFICLDGTGKSYRVKVINSRTFSSLNVDLIEYQDLDQIPVGRGLIVKRFGSTYQIPNGLVNSLGISSVLQAKIINHNVKLAATNVQPPDTLYLQELSGTTAISDGDTIPLIDYVRVVDTAAAFASYLKRPVGWGLSLLTGKYPLVDSLKVASRYFVGANYFPLEGGTLTGTGGAGFIGFPSQVSAPGTPASGLNIYAQGSSFNWKGTDGYERQFASTLTGGRTYTLPNVSGTFALGTGTTNLVPLWTATNTLGNSNIQDNGTAVSILSSKPFQLGQWTTAGRPTGTNGYAGFNTSFNWPEWYSSSGWFSPLQSSLTGGLGTAGSVIFLDANGRATQDNANLFWNNSTKRLGIGTTSPSQALEIYTPTTTSIDLLKLQTATNAAANIKFNMNAFQGTISGNLLKITATQGTGPYIQQQTQLIEMGFTTSSSSNKVNVLSALNITGKFGFAFTSNTSRIHDAIQQTSFVSGFDRGLDFNVYDHRTNGTLDKGEILFRMSPSKEVWVGDQSVNTSYSFNVTQPSLGYGAIVTTAGSANVTGLGLSTFFTKDFNVGSTLTVNGNSYTVASITNDYTMSFTSTVPTSGQYAYTITGNTNRLGVYKNGGVIITPATGQPRYELTISGTQGVSIPRGTVAQRPTIVASTTPFRYNTDSTALEYGESVGTWRQIATRPYVRSLIAAVPTSNIYTANGSLTADRTLHGAGYTLRFNANTIIRDSLKVANLADHTNPDSIVTTKGGYLGKKKFLMSTDSFVYVRNSGFAISDKYAGWQISGDNHFYVSFADTSGYYQNIAYSKDFDYVGQYGDISIGYINTRVDKSGQRSAWDMDVSNVVYSTDNLSQIFYADSSGIVKFSYYGAGTKTATALSKTQSNYAAGFATDGTVTSLEVKRDTTVYLVDTDLDWSAAITTAQISRRYNRVIFLMTTTAAAGSNSDLTLHTPDVNLMQCEYLIRSTDEAGGFTNTIQFGSNNAVDSGNTLVSSYTPSPGQGVGIRAGLRSGVYKYWYY